MEFKNRNRKVLTILLSPCSWRPANCHALKHIEKLKFSEVGSLPVWCQPNSWKSCQFRLGFGELAHWKWPKSQLQSLQQRISCLSVYDELCSHTYLSRRLCWHDSASRQVFLTLQCNNLPFCCGRSVKPSGHFPFIQNNLTELHLRQSWQWPSNLRHGAFLTWHGSCTQNAHGQQLEKW